MANKRDEYSHTKWLCKYHIVFTPKYRRKIIYGSLRGDIGKILKALCQHSNLKYKFGNRHFWSDGYYVSTVGLNAETIRKYIRDREVADIAHDKLTRERNDPFKG